MIKILFFLAVIVVLVLAGIAANLLWKVYKQEQVLKARQAEADQKYQEARNHLNNSIQIIAKALLDGQVGYAEASIRISKLMDQLSVGAEQRSDFVVFDKMAESIAHIPILDAWKSLSRQERKQFEQEIETKEKEYADFLSDAARRINGKHF